MTHTPVGHCNWCKLPVDPDGRGVYHEVQGWAMNRAKGINAIALKRETGGLCCSTCMDLLKQGIAPLQGTLFESFT